jgi:hypothetical protein
MDEETELLNLEAELKRLRPVAASRPLLARLESELSPRRSAPFWGGWLALPAAAGLALVAAIGLRRDAILPAAQPSAPAPASFGAAPAFKPVSADDLLVGARDDGYLTMSDGTRARRTRQSYVDTITWEDPGSHASLRWSVPRQEVRVEPVSFQ